MNRFATSPPLRYTKLLRFLLEREPGRRIGAATATNYPDPIRLALSWALKQGFIPLNPIIGIPRCLSNVASIAFCPIRISMI
ncbi:MAG: hypothetical protein GX768_03935 [Chloroflexi bacterium]|nr:hypothetical protein [Chloroflexota bacterium]